MDSPLPLDTKPLPNEALPFDVYRIQDVESRSERRRRIFRKLALLFVSFAVVFLFFRDHVGGICKDFASSSFVNQPPIHHWPIPDDVSVDDCRELAPDATLEAPSVSFSLPVSSKKLFLLSRGAYATGSVQIVQSDQEGDDVDVEIKAYADSNRYEVDLNHLVKACTVSRGVEDHGVGLFTWRRRHEHLHLTFDILVTLPKSASIQGFELDLPVFDVSIGDLSTVSFASFTQKSAVSSVRSEILVANVVALDIASGSIHGHFNTSSYLELRQANGNIEVTIDATNKDFGFPTVVKLLNDHGEVNASLALHSTNSTGGSFSTISHVSAGSINLNFTGAPNESALTVDSSTSVGAINVGLDKSFEGEFLLANTMGGRSLVYDSEDEKNKGRYVDVEQAGRGRLTGVVYRTEQGKKRGSVSLKNTIGDVRLVL